MHGWLAPKGARKAHCTPAGTQVEGMEDVRIRYTVPVERKVRVVNHWPFTWLGGEFRLVETDGLITAIQVTFSGQPASMAPHVARHDEGKIRATISDRDRLMPVIQRRLRRGLAYVQCMFQVEFEIARIKSEFEPESDDERKQIKGAQ
jgi:hypothetical protein